MTKESGFEFLKEFREKGEQSVIENARRNQGKTIPFMLMDLPCYLKYTLEEDFEDDCENSEKPQGKAKSNEKREMFYYVGFEIIGIVVTEEENIFESCSPKVGYKADIKKLDLIKGVAIGVDSLVGAIEKGGLTPSKGLIELLEILRDFLKKEIKEEGEARVKKFTSLLSIDGFTIPTALECECGEKKLIDLSGNRLNTEIFYKCPDCNAKHSLGKHEELLENTPSFQIIKDLEDNIHFEGEIENSKPIKCKCGGDLAIDLSDDELECDIVYFCFECEAKYKGNMRRYFKKKTSQENLTSGYTSAQKVEFKKEEAQTMSEERVKNGDEEMATKEKVSKEIDYSTAEALQEYGIEHLSSAEQQVILNSEMEEKK